MLLEFFFCSRDVEKVFNGEIYFDFFYICGCVWDIFIDRFGIGGRFEFDYCLRIVLYGGVEVVKGVYDGDLL